MWLDYIIDISNIDLKFIYNQWISYQKYFFSEGQKKYYLLIIKSNVVSSLGMETIIIPLNRNCYHCEFRPEILFQLQWPKTEVQNGGPKCVKFRH